MEYRKRKEKTKREKEANIAHGEKIKEADAKRHEDRAEEERRAVVLQNLARTRADEMERDPEGSTPHEDQQVEAHARMVIAERKEAAAKKEKLDAARLEADHVDREKQALLASMKDDLNDF